MCISNNKNIYLEDIKNMFKIINSVIKNYKQCY